MRSKSTGMSSNAEGKGYIWVRRKYKIITCVMLHAVPFHANSVYQTLIKLSMNYANVI